MQRFAMFGLWVCAGSFACGGETPNDAGDVSETSANDDVAVDSVEDVASDPLTVRFVESPLDFGSVPQDAIAVRDALIVNTGAAPVRFDRMVFAGHLGFSVTLAGQRYGVTAETASSGVALDPSPVIEAGQSLPITVTYEATGPEAAQATVLLFVAGDGRAIELKAYANLEGPCIKTNPTRVAFGGAMVGQSKEVALEIQSCGGVDLIIDDIALVEDGGGVFGLDVGRVGTLPLTVPAGSSIYVPISYTPTATAPLDAEGNPVLEHGRVRITSNAYLRDLDVSIDAFGVGEECPTAAITVTEGDEVVPGTLLHLSGSDSTSTRGINAWQWSVVQPGGALSTFMPSPYVASPTFEVDVAGTYLFRLTVTDSLGIESCAPAEYTVVVTSRDAIHIELTWHTPGDLNETDTGGDQIYFSVGSDLDLFLDPAPSAEPRDRDDTDGAGPENISVRDPVDGTYDVLVYYNNDWGYGPSFATLRVYIEGVLREEWADVELTNRDLWRALSIDWPAGLVTRPSSEPDITHDVAPGEF